MISDLSGTAAYLGDIIAVGRSENELQDRINQLLSRIQEYGFRLRAEKCHFFRSIKYLVFIFDSKSRRPDSQNVRTISDMPAPTNVSNLRSFLGLAKFFSSCLPSLHEMRAPLNKLLQKGMPCHWSAACKHAFEKLKAMLSFELLLTHYDPKLPLIFAADTSNYGVGAVISHILPNGFEKAIAHALRTLTPVENNYSPIEKEALAIIYVVKEFHKLVCGRRLGS